MKSLSDRIKKRVVRVALGTHKGGVQLHTLKTWAQEAEALEADSAKLTQVRALFLDRVGRRDSIIDIDDLEIALGDAQPVQKPAQEAPGCVPGPDAGKDSPAP